MNDKLVVFDFDGTLVHEDGRTENFSLLTDLKRKGVELTIASRNHWYHVIRELSRLKIQDSFTFIMADFRPKSIQIRDILYRYQQSNRSFKQVYFIDDYHVNIERVNTDLPSVNTIHYGVSVTSLEEAIAAMELN